MTLLELYWRHPMKTSSTSADQGSHRGSIMTDYLNRLDSTICVCMSLCLCWSVVVCVLLMCIPGCECLNFQWRLLVIYGSNSLGTRFDTPSLLASMYTFLLHKELLSTNLKFLATGGPWMLKGTNKNFEANCPKKSEKGEVTITLFSFLLKNIRVDDGPVYSGWQLCCSRIEAY